MAHAPAAQRDMSLAEYEALVERGVLAEAKVELVDGQVVSMSPQGEDHAWTIRRLMVLLAPAIADLAVQMPERLPPTSMPEPDLALTPPTRPRRDAPSAARLVIEVVVSQWYEAVRKVPVYAAGGIGECWIVDVPRRCVHVHIEPEGRAYRRTRVLRGDDELAPPGTDIRFTVADVFSTLDES